MNGKSFLRGFLDQLEKRALGMGIGAGPTQSMTPPPVGGMLKQRRPPRPMSAAAGAPTPMQPPVPARIG